MLRTRSWAILGGALALLALAPAGRGQPAPAIPVQNAIKRMPVPGSQPKAGARDAAALSSIKIVEESKYRQVINVARDCIKDKDWAQAVKALQTILDIQGDNYVQVRETDASGQPTLRWTSVKFEANNLLAATPVEGLEAYEVAYGARAKDLLDEAKTKGDRELLAEVGQRYCHTRAGLEANELLATLFLARGQNFMAALRFEKLLALPAERTKLSETALYKAALAFHRAGDDARAAETWKRLEPSLKEAGGLRVGERVIPLAQLYEVLHGASKAEPVNLHDWLMVRGNVSNTAQANGSAPLLDKDLWRRPLLNAPALDGRDQEPESQKRVAQVIEQLHKLGQPVLPGFFPIATQGRLLYRSYGQINSVFIKKTRDAQGEHEPGELEWRSMQLEGSLPALLETSPTRGNPHRDKVEAWLATYAPSPGVSSLLFENSTIGTLSCDHKCVYALDDLAVPPPPGNIYAPFTMNMQAQAASDMKPLVMRNNLVAYKIVGGKIDWDTKDEPDFTDSHFLGVPISVGGKLYALNEKNSQNGSVIGDAELRLVCIDPSKRGADNRPTIVRPIQMLGLVQQQDRVTKDLSRRINAVHLAYGEGTLVCPTNAGEVFGVDLMTRSLVWSYPYREESPTHLLLGPQAGPAGGPVIFPGRPGMTPQPLGALKVVIWKSAPPAIADGKVVFTAPDAHSVHCINLRDGTPVWKRKHNDGDLYLAGVYQGRVLIVGKNVVRAYSLKDGTELWRLTTGDLPSGQGVASKNIYYLPLQKSEILAIDIEKGLVKAHNRATDAKTLPGNLVFNDGAVLSQTANEIVAFPQLAMRLDLAKHEAEATPADLDKRATYGEMLLKDGQVQAAVTELRSVTAKAPPAPLGRRASDRLFEALTDLMQTDFHSASQRYLDDFKALTTATDDPQERQQRLAKFFRIVGQGREAQGNLVEAFRMYKDFGALPIHHEQGGVASADDPGQKIPTHVWLRGRISAMIARATPEQREPLEQQIAAEWQAVEAKNDLGALRSFAGMFDVPFKVGREARLRLAEAIMDRNDRASFLEAELYLQQLLGEPYRHDPATAGRALAALALLEEKKGTVDSMKLAASYYRVLAHEFPQARVRQAKTGTDLLSELQADKRYLPFLEETASRWEQGPIKVRELSPDPSGTHGPSGFVLTPEGDQTPFARQHRLLIDRVSVPYHPTVRLVDVATGRERWAEPLSLGNSGGPVNQQIINLMYHQQQIGDYHPNARFRFCHVKGHLMVFQVGAMIYCIDGDNGKKLWEEATLDGLNQPNVVPQGTRANADPDANPEFILWNQLNGQKTRGALGHVGAVEASYVALLTQKGLVVNDPLRGTLLWSRAVENPAARVFGDEQYIYLVEGTDGSSKGRVLRATDGETLNVPDFGPIYQHRLRLLGRRILAAVPTKDGLTLKLYDIVAGKDVWSKAFPAGTVVTQTEDRDLTGVIDPKGRLSALDVETGRVVLNTSVLQGRNVTAAEIKNLSTPLLLQDRDHYYVALNHPVEANKIGGGLQNNFSNGLRCAPVNGWFLALHRQAGETRRGGRVRPFAKGELAWDSFEPILNQMIVLEQFENLPVLVFSCRYNELINAGAMGNRWVSETRSFERRSGSLLYPLTAGAKHGSMSPQFVSFQVDQRAGTITLDAGGSGAIQHYLDDGRAPARQEGRMAPPNPALGATTGLRPGLVNGRILIRPRLPLQPAPPPPR
jgi:outer membrane protein assembly factor BamB